MLQNVRLLDSIGIIKSLGSIPFTWCHDLSSANSWLKVIHPTIRHKHFVLSIFVDDLESTILNRSSVRFHGIRSVYIPRSFSRDHHISAILARAAKAAHVISRKRPGSELTTERPFLAARFWVESSTECDRNLQFKTDLGFHRSNESLKRWKWNCRCSYLVRTGILIEMEIKRRGEEKSVQIKSFDIPLLSSVEGVERYVAKLDEWKWKRTRGNLLVRETRLWMVRLKIFLNLFHLTFQ